MSNGPMRTLQEKAAEQYAVAMRYQDHVNRDPRRQKRDGVVVTPIEVVDFQVRSLFEQLRVQGRAPDEGIEWLDPFGGTGVYMARILQLADLPPHRKAILAEHCVVIEIDPDAAQFAADNLAAVHAEETGWPGYIRVICTDTFALNPHADLWDEQLFPTVMPSLGAEAA